MLQAQATRCGWCRTAGQLARLMLLLLILLSAAIGAANTLEINAGDDPSARLEVRRATLPSGAEVEWLVLRGERIELNYEGQRIIGQWIEIDTDRGLVRIIGDGSFERGDERVVGLDLELDLDEERVLAIAAVVFTSAIDVSGDLADRLPGQVLLINGLASPCSRCGREVLDYAFRAERMTLYPGDRLVAQRVDILLRGVRVLYLPLLVIPLAEGDRQPAFLIRSGSNSRPAEVLLRWPYVLGGGALGTFTLRYLADILADPDGRGLSDRLLGGEALSHQFGATLDHRFFDDVGAGRLFIDYLPAFPELPSIGDRPARAEATEPLWTVRINYRSDAIGLEPSVNLALERQDARVPGRTTYQFAVEQRDRQTLAGIGVAMRFESVGFIDSDERYDIRTAPSYAGRGTPLRTPLRFTLEAIDSSSLRLGPLRVAAFSVDIGTFQDVADPSNRRAAALGIVSDGRIRFSQHTVLDRWSLWRGLSLEADNRFSGHYYGSLERAVNWNARFSLQQSFGNVLNLNLTLLRVLVEGETPFRFDSSVGQARDEARFGVSLRPLAWFELDTRSSYIFSDRRRPDDVGWDPLVTTLNLFRNLRGIEASAEHRWLIREEDLGTLDTNLVLTGAQGPASLRVQLRQLWDLQVEQEEGEPRISQSNSRVQLSVAVQRVLEFEASGSYTPHPAPNRDGDFMRLAPVDLRLDLGSQRSADRRPGVRLSGQWDPQNNEPLNLTIAARAAYADVEVTASERIDLRSGAVSDPRIGVSWAGRFNAELRGFIWLPSALLPFDYPEASDGLPPARAQSISVADPGRVWQLTWQSTLDPRLSDGDRRDTRLEARVSLLSTMALSTLFNIEASGDWALADAVQPERYLRRGALTFGADIAGRIGVSASLRYQATYDRANETLGRAELNIGNATISGWLNDQWLVGARISDVWEFRGSDPERSPWNLQPEFFFVWDRCCWSLSGLYNSADGSFRVLLSGPGGAGGLEQILDTGLALPRAPLPEEEGTP